MSKLTKKSNTPLSNQGQLFDAGMSDGALDRRLAFRDALTKALSKCRLSRWQIAAEISRLSGRELSKDMLDKCTSSNFDYGLRAEDLPALLFAVDSLEPIRVLLTPIGCEVADPAESELVRLARLEQKNAELLDEIAALRSKLGLKR